jgi:hypothetical protein
MSQTNDIRSIQKRTIQLINYEDGLWDLLLGCIFMLLAIYPVTRERLGPEWNLVFFLGGMALLVIIFTAARRYISAPRMGYVRSRRSPAQRGLLIATVILFVLTLGMVILTLVYPAWIPDLSGIPNWLEEYFVDILVLFAIVAVFSVLGYLSGVARLYIYGWLLGIANLASVVGSQNTDWVFNLPLALAAGIIILVGLWHLVRFIQRYPVSTQEA